MNFRQVRKKIRTVSNVKQITKAMQMVASVKMKKAQDAAVEGGQFRDHLRDMLSRVVERADVSALQYITPAKESAERSLYIIISSNKGLCGSFNYNLAKLCLEKVDFAASDFIIMGKKGSEFTIKMKGNILTDFSDQLPFIDNVSAIFSVLSERFLSGKNSKVFLVYNKFESTLRHTPTITQLVPVSGKYEGEGQEERAEPVKGEYLIEPSPEAVLQSLIVDFIQDRIRAAILDSEASEHSARMIAMKNATDSASDLIGSLTLLRNKLRQTSITNELLDITTAQISSE